MSLHLVIPSIREDQLNECLENVCSCNPPPDKIWVMQDAEESTFQVGTPLVPVKLLSRKDAKRDWGNHYWILSRRNAACRIYGFWRAFKDGADIIVTLDDDCRVKEDFFFHDHQKRLNETHEERAWFCTVESLNKPARGTPYRALTRKVDVVLNHGMWTGSLDYDAPAQLYGGGRNETPALVYPSTEEGVVPPGVYFPMCSMNLAFNASITPAMYFPLMGEGQPFDRFDDIWCGILVKKVLDACGLRAHTGLPYVEHTRASDPLKNLAAEAPGILYNEEFWKTVDRIILPPSSSVRNTYWELAKKLEAGAVSGSYLQGLGRAMQAWVEVCK